VPSDPVGTPPHSRNTGYLREEPCEIVTVTEPAAHLLCAADLYGPQIRALQLVHADDRGHWPWDRGYRGVRGGQPVLGVRTARPGAAPDPGPG